MDKKVYIEPCENYDESLVEEKIEKLLEDNNLLSFAQQGKKIAIKANLVVAFAPERAATVHPSLLFALTKILVSKGCKVVIGDSPGGLFNDAFLNPIYNKLGLSKAVQLGAELNHNYSHSKETLNNSLTVKELDISDWLKDCDYIINFAKLKSHGMMSLSAATKNMFGSVPGTVKMEYHYRYPNQSEFGKMLVDIQEYYKPVLHIVDAIDGMQGNGPTQGTPKHVGLLLAATNPYNLDLVCSKVIDLDVSQVSCIKEAALAGLACNNVEEVELNQNIDSYVVKDFEKISHPDTMEFYTEGKIKWFGKIAKKVLEVKPVCDKKTCIGCKKCHDICPAKAITMKNNRPVIDRKKCIKCFCCQEFCLVGSMRTHRTLFSKIIGK